MPAPVRMPAVVRMPAAVRMPAVVRMPAAVRMPAVVRMPAAVRMPAVVRMPAAVRMPAVVRMPACHSRRFKGERPIGAATGQQSQPPRPCAKSPPPPPSQLRQVGQCGPSPLGHGKRVPLPSLRSDIMTSAASPTTTNMRVTNLIALSPAVLPQHSPHTSSATPGPAHSVVALALWRAVRSRPSCPLP